MRTIMRACLFASLLACVANAGRILETEDNAEEVYACKATANPDSLPDGPTCFPLLTELQEAEIGSVCVELASHNTTRIVFETSGAWTMMETYLWGDRDRTAYPIEQGAPKLDAFPHKFQTPIASTTWEVTLPLDDMVGCSPTAYEGDLQTYLILSAKVENLFDFSGPRRTVKVHGHEHWLSMTNGKGSVSRFFSYMEVDLLDVQCDCELLPVPDLSLLSLLSGPGKTSGETSEEESDLSNPAAEVIPDDMIEATEVVVGSTFTVVQHSKDQDHDILKDILNEVFDDFVSEVMRRHQVGSAPALRRRTSSTVGVELDAGSPHVYHYMTSTACPDSVEIEGAECHNAVARYTLLIDDSESIKGVCQTFMHYTQETLDLGLLHNSVAVAAAEVSLKLSIQDVSIAYCGTAADDVLTTRVIPPTDSTVEVEEITETEETDTTFRTTTTSSSGDSDSGPMMMIVIILVVFACCCAAGGAKYWRGDVEVDTQVQNAVVPGTDKNYSFDPATARNEEIQAMTDVRVV